MALILPTADFKLSYGASDDRLNDFYIPALSCSVRYDRSAGYFSSAALSIAAAGIARLIQNGGRMRLLVGAELLEDDVSAIIRGHDLASVVERNLLEGFRDPEDMLMRKRLEALAWMVAEAMLEIKVVLPTKNGKPIPSPDSRDYYHPKEGLFTDAEGNQVAFSGSINESEQAWRNNYEQFSVYCSWKEDRPHLLGVVSRFERLWQGKERDWIAFEIPEAVRKRMLSYRPQGQPKSDPFEKEQVKEPDREEHQQKEHAQRVMFQFLRDAPHLVNSGLLGIATSAVKPWPHQINVVRKAVDSFPERFLLCDEVGLGKTIEAGLILRQLLVSGLVRRFLLLAPKSICRQWQEELYEKLALNVPFYTGSKFVDVLGKTSPCDDEN
ncbi:helicase, partial [bacterium]|nr:helicase [bacterium]